MAINLTQLDLLTSSKLTISCWKHGNQCIAISLISSFLSTEAPAYYQEYVSDWIKSFPVTKDQDSALRNLKEMLCDLSDKYTNSQEDFMKFVDKESSMTKPKSFGVSLCFRTVMHIYLFT